MRICWSGVRKLKWFVVLEMINKKYERKVLYDNRL